MDLTTNQERTIDALCLFHGGWVQTSPLANEKVLVRTAGDQPDYGVWPDGGTLRLGTPEDSRPHRFSAEEIQLAVYGVAP